MTKRIEGVPESFTREQYNSIFEAIGIDPFKIRDLHFDHTGVRATVFEFDADGNHIVTDAGAAKHLIYIPVEPYTQESAK